MTDRGPSIRTRESVYLDPPPSEVKQDRVTDQLRLEQAHRRRANGKLILGMAIGAMIAIGTTMYFAWDRGSFSGAGAVIDRQIDATARGSQDVAAGAARSVGGAARVTGDTVDKQMSNVADQAER